MSTDHSSEQLAEQFIGPIITATEDGTVLSWNAAAERVFGYRAEEVLNKSYHELLIPSERLPESLKWFSLALEKGSATYDSIKKTRNGVLFDVEVAIKVLNPGEPAPVVAINIRDITVLKCLRNAKLLE